MTTEEAIELLKGMQSPLEDYAELVGAPAFAYGHKYVYPYPQDYAIEEAIEALKEIQMYKDGKLLLVPEDVYSRQCSELDAYKEIGTVEKCREAVEKQVKMSEIKLKCQVCGTEFEPKKENRYTGIGFGMFVNTLYDCYDCPKCGSQYRAKERIKEAKCNE